MKAALSFYVHTPTTPGSFLSPGCWHR